MTSGRDVGRDRPSAHSFLIAAHASANEQFGGAFKVATELAEFLAGRAHRVFYVCGTEERAPVNPQGVNGVELWRYPFPRARSPHPANLLGHVLGAYRLTRQILRQSPPICLNGHGPLQFLGASLAAGKDRVRQVYTVHSPFADEIQANHPSGQAGLRQRMMLMAARSIEGVNCRRATTVHCLSQFTASRIARTYGKSAAEKTVVAQGWVDTCRFRPLADVQGARAALGPEWQTEKPVFLTVRRLEARMGIDALVEAAGILAGQGFEFRVLVGGSGSLEGDLRQRVQQSGLNGTVRFLGRISEANLPLCFAAADCFVLPTRGLECFGLIILEAYSSGTPVIGTPVGAIPELLALQGEGWLTGDTTAAAIADRMAAFLRGGLVADPRQLCELAGQWRAESGLERLSRILLPRAEDPPLLPGDGQAVRASW